MIARLQAPFLIALAVVLVHVFATFAPQIRSVYESVEWWLWFVPVGIAVVVFAARFERNMLRKRGDALSSAPLTRPPEIGCAGTSVRADGAY